MDLGLEGARALVPGGSRGIGRAIAAALLGEDARVAICARSPEEVASAAASLARTVEAGEGEVHGTAFDVAAPGGAEDAVASAVERLGGLDLLVGNVGGASGGSLAESTAEDWAATFEVNVGHCVRALRAALPALAASDRASVLFVSSISGHKPAPRHSTERRRRRRPMRRRRSRGSWRPSAFGSTPSPPGRPSSMAEAGTSFGTRIRSGSRGSSSATFRGAGWEPRRRWRTRPSSCSRPARPGLPARTSRSTAPRDAPAPAAGEASRRSPRRARRRGGWRLRRSPLRIALRQGQGIADVVEPRQPGASPARRHGCMGLAVPTSRSPAAPALPGEGRSIAA